MIIFGVGLPGPPVYGTTVEIENGPTLFWNGRGWQTEPVEESAMFKTGDRIEVHTNEPPDFPTDIEHENAAGYFENGDEQDLADQGDLTPYDMLTREDLNTMDGAAIVRGKPGRPAVLLAFRGAGWPTKTSHQIMEELLPMWFRQFMEKQADYGDRGDELGLAGQYAELDRKMGKLKKVMWNGEPLVGEKLDQVLLDLIGHGFLSLRYYLNGLTGNKGVQK